MESPEKILKQKLEVLQKAFEDVNKIWHEETKLCDNVLTENYPFAKSFDEMTHAVEKWTKNPLRS